MPYEMDVWEIKLATWNSPFFFSLNALESLTDKKGYILKIRVAFKMVHFQKTTAQDIFIKN